MLRSPHRVSASTSSEPRDPFAESRAFTLSLSTISLIAMVVALTLLAILVATG